MAKSAEVSMNVSAIRLVDRFVCDIVDTATHVVLYEFNAQTYEWEKTNAEGALFIYNRNGDPRYSIIVLNRLNTENLVEPVDEGIDIQLQEPFLLYRNSRSEIHGIWFYDRDECVRIAKTIERLVKEVTNIKNSMDSRLKGSDLHKSQPETPDGTSKRVMDFFARAGSKAPSQPPGLRAPPPGLPSMSREKQLSDVNPLLQRLMSNPNPITVEQLEKQHRSSPQDIQKIRGKPGIMKKENQRRPLTLPVHTSSKIENGMNLLNLGESPPQGYTPSSIPSSISTQHFFNSGITHSPSEPLEVSVLEQSMETPTKPALIPPVMFASAKEETPLVVKPEPLTKSQLLQAVTYLLKNDADFINKLHEAYVKSFVDMVS